MKLANAGGCVWDIGGGGAALELPLVVVPLELVEVDDDEEGRVGTSGQVNT